MSEIKLEDDHLDASHGPTKMLLAAEYWKREAEYLRRRIKQLEMKMNDPIPDQMQITLADIEENIADEYYFTGSDHIADRGVAQWHPSLDLITFCILILKNGFSVTGTSACSSHSYYSAEVGREVAREKAIQNVWPLMAYALKEKLAEK